MYKFQKHAVDNCRVLKKYSLQHIFNVAPQVAERLHRTTDNDVSSSSNAAQEEAALDAELVEWRERAQKVRALQTRLRVRNAATESLMLPSSQQATAKSAALQQEESILSQQLAQCSSQLELLSSLAESGTLFVVNLGALAWHNSLP